jgi:hypothetical protein
MPTKINVADYIGKKYGKLTILSEAPPTDKGNNTRFITRCDCGNIKNVSFRNLRAGNTKSCGCLGVEYHAKRITHGLTKHRLYHVWYKVVERCINPDVKDYYRYGGRGIKICEGWKKDVTVFYNWAINNGWAEGLQIDRINNNGNYEPANCRFVTPAINGLNRRNNVYVNYRGKIVALGLLAKEYNLNRATLLERVNKGWDIKKAVTTKTRKWSRV